MFPNADAVNEALRFPIALMQENQPPEAKTQPNKALESNE
jgi:hypothetical protein